MIYITGDCHSNFQRFNNSIFPEQAEMTKDDYVIICGDFGGVSSHDIDGGTCYQMGIKWTLSWQSKCEC